MTPARCIDLISMLSLRVCIAATHDNDVLVVSFWVAEAHVRAQCCSDQDPVYKVKELLLCIQRPKTKHRTSYELRAHIGQLRRSVS